MYYLITPSREGPDTILAVNGFGKSPVELVNVEVPVSIAGHRIIAYPKLTRFEMSGNSGAQTYQVMMALLTNAADLHQTGDSFATAWQRLCQLSGLEGRITVLLVNEFGKFLLYTFDTHTDEFDIVHVREFTEATMYQQGRVLTHTDIMTQLTERRRAKDHRLHRSFNALDLGTGFDLQSLELE